MAGRLKAGDRVRVKRPGGDEFTGRVADASIDVAESWHLDRPSTWVLVLMDPRDMGGARRFARCVEESECEKIEGAP